VATDPCAAADAPHGAPPARGRQGPDTTPSLPPAELVGDSVEALLAERGAGGSALYLLLLLIVSAAVAALPLVEVPVTLRAPGLLRPAIEKHEIRAAGDGMVLEILVRENEHVRRGQPLLRTSRAGITERAAGVRAERAAAMDLARDLERLTGSGGRIAVTALRTRRYRLSLQQHLADLGEHAARLGHLEREAERAAELTARGLLPLLELEERELGVDLERRRGAMLTRSAVLGWERELAELRTRLARLRTEEEVLRAEARLAEITAPVAGTLEQLSPLSTGSVVSAGDRIAVISPDTAVVAVVYADARVAALLAPGARARLELEAYPAAEWGVATGRVMEIAADAVELDGELVFPLTIELDAPRLALPNGRSGELRKGMALQARFTLVRRTLWELLRDDLGDWLDPRKPGG
jgi:multidrug efflux pump subunit AcrA (membrane-fusion protein)